MGAYGLSLRKFSLYANYGVESGKVEPGSSFKEIDKSISLENPGIYVELCKDVLSGPEVLVVKSAKELGGKIVIGFTRESKLNASGNDGNPIPGNGRYVFYWDKEILRCVLYKTDKFKEFAKFQELSDENTTVFSFPELRKLASAGPMPKTIPSASAAPKLSEKMFPSPSPRNEKDSNSNQSTLSKLDNHKMSSRISPWIFMLGVSAMAVILFVIIRKKITRFGVSPK